MGDRRRIMAPIKVREVEVGDDVIDHGYGPGQWGLLENVQNIVCLGTLCIVVRCKYPICPNCYIRIRLKNVTTTFVQKSKSWSRKLGFAYVHCLDRQIVCRGAWIRK